jgi:protease-4
LVTATRVGLANLLFLALVIFILVLMFGGEKQTVAKKSVLLLAPTGVVVDQRSFVDPLARLVNPAALLAETALYDLIESVQQGAKDPRIVAMALDLDELQQIDTSSARELGAAIKAFSATGKKVVAMGDSFDQSQYLLASYADEIYLHSMGEVGIKGMGVYPQYFKELLDKLNVDVHVFRVGEYKSAVEPFLLNDMSDSAKRNNLRWLQSVWANYTSTVGLNRDLDPASIDDYANHYDTVLAGAEGNAALAALNRGLIDKVAGRDQMLQRVAELAGRPGGEELLLHSYDYLTPGSLMSPLQAQGDVVAVVVAEGPIVDGEQPPGMAGGDSVAALLKKAREDSSVKAVVLRVNSPGGSAFASEIIREQVMLTQQAGKPVVTSMGNMAASGGYWIAADTAEIWAQPTTITGSIGIFGVFPTIDRTLSNWGIHSGGVGTTRMADAFRIDRPLSDVSSKALQATIDNGYQRFVNLVAQARGMSVEAVDSVAQGQVWSGEDALAVGLVDSMGGLEDAVAAAAKLADLSSYETVWMSDDDWLRAGLLQRMIGASARAFSQTVLANLFGDMASLPWLQKTVRLPVLNDPRGVYMQCLECTQ